jgi:CHAT domain-containing protein
MAGQHGSGESRDGSVLDRVISSYTPTLRALIHARGRTYRTGPDTADPNEKLLLVSLPATPNQAFLPYVIVEREAVTQIVGTAHCTLLEGDRATRRDVADALADHRWAHFSGHGTQDLSNPSQGGLLLYDGILGVNDIAAATAERGQLAFLSACKTATGGTVQADEALNFATALHYIGWQHVIGTLWSVYDDTAADLTANTYAGLLADGTITPHKAASALHRAVRALRDPAQAARWAPFVHLGP